MNRIALALALALLPSLSLAQSFRVEFSKEASAQPLDGRLLLCLSTDPSDEPRNQINDTPKSQIVFGVTVDGWKPGETQTVDASAWGYPVPSLKDLKPGEYVEFSTLFEPEKGVPLLVVSFLAILELTRELLIEVSQKSPFEPIYVKLKSERATLTIA